MQYKLYYFKISQCIPYCFHFLGCFNSSTALWTSYIGKPNFHFTSAMYAVCILKPYFASMYSLIILLVTRSFGLYATALLAILYYQAALFLRIDNTIWLFSGQKHDTFNGITRFPQNLPYFFTITIYRKVKLNRL